MKTYYLILAMICSMFAFAACSDDDKGGDGGDCPITGYSVKTLSVAMEGELILEGKGFTQDSKIFLKDAAGKLTEIPVKTVSNADIVCTLPATGLTVGQYTVVLRQEGKDWEMGKMTVTAALPIKDYSFEPEGISGKDIQIKGTGFKECEIYLKPDEGDAIQLTNVVKTEDGVTAFIPIKVVKGDYTLIVKQDGVEQELGLLKIVGETKRLVSIELFEPKMNGEEINYESAYVQKFEYDEATGKLSGFTKGSRHITLDYSIPGKVVKNDGEDSYTYNLTDGKANEITDDNNNVWTVNYQDGFISTMDGDIWGTPTTVTYLYAGQDLTSVGDGQPFGMGPIYGTITFGGYGEKSLTNNIDGVDIFAIIMSELSVPDSDIRWYGIAGNMPARLPATIFSEDAGYDYELAYGMQGKYVTKISFIDKTKPNLKDYPNYYELTWE